MPERVSGIAGACSLPDDFRQLFWDHDFDALELPTHGPLIISRVLTSGSWTAIRWLRDHVSDNDLRHWIESRDGRPLSRQQLRFW